MKKSLGASALALHTPVWLVGAYDKNGKANLMVAAWAGITCSKPASVGVSLRSATYTHGCVMARRAFTVNIPSEEHVRQADFCGIASGRDVDKFSETGLTAVKSELVDAPYVAEFPLVLECALTQVMELGLHTHFIGEILDVKAEESVLDDRNAPLMDRVKPILYGPKTQAYFAVGRYLGQGFSIGRK